MLFYLVFNFTFLWRSNFLMMIQLLFTFLSLIYKREFSPHSCHAGNWHRALDMLDKCSTTEQLSSSVSFCPFSRMLMCLNVRVVVFFIIGVDRECWIFKFLSFNKFKKYLTTTFRLSSLSGTACMWNQTARSGDFLVHFSQFFSPPLTSLDNFIDLFLCLLSSKISIW